MANGSLACDVGKRVWQFPSCVRVLAVSTVLVTLGSVHRRSLEGPGAHEPPNF